MTQSEPRTSSKQNGQLLTPKPQNQQNNKTTKQNKKFLNVVSIFSYAPTHVPQLKNCRVEALFSFCWKSRSVQQVSVPATEIATPTLTRTATDAVLRRRGALEFNLADDAVSAVSARSADFDAVVVRLERLSTAQVVEAWNAEITADKEVRLADLKGGRGGR